MISGLDYFPDFTIYRVREGQRYHNGQLINYTEQPLIHLINNMSQTSAVPALKKFWKQTAFLGFIAIVAAYSVKQNVTIRRKKQFVKEASSYDSLMQERVRERSGDSISTVKPGFPIDDGIERYQRKSEYEGAGMSFRSRRTGDKFTWSHFFTDYTQENENDPKHPK